MKRPVEKSTNESPGSPLTPLQGRNLDDRNAGSEPAGSIGPVQKPLAGLSAKQIADGGISAGDKVDHVPAQSRDSAAVEIADWVATHWDATHKLLYRLTMNRHDAEDLTQETFLRAIERRSSFQAGTNLRAWLLRIATNAFLDRQRRKKVMKITPLPEEISFDSASPGQGLEDAERHKSVEAAIATLPEVQRIIFLLRGQEELSFREIGESIGMTEETARWHMMQARRQLLVKLNGIL